MRPQQPWGDVVRVLNRGPEAGWTAERLRRTVRRLVSEGIVEAKLLDRASQQRGDDRLLRLVVGIASAAPDRTLQQIAAQLEAMHERTPRAEPDGIPRRSSTCSIAQRGWVWSHPNHHDWSGNLQSGVSRHITLRLAPSSAGQTQQASSVLR